MARMYQLSWAEQAQRTVEVDEAALCELLQTTPEVLRETLAAGQQPVTPDSLYDDLAEFDEQADLNLERSDFEVAMLRAS